MEDKKTIANNILPWKSHSAHVLNTHCTIAIQGKAVHGAREIQRMPKVNCLTFKRERENQFQNDSGYFCEKKGVVVHDPRPKLTSHTHTHSEDTLNFEAILQQL